MLMRMTFIFLFSMCVWLACGQTENPVPKPSCSDGIENGTETGIDCGGDCPPCTTNIGVPAGGYETPSSYEGYELVWGEEFDGARLDASKWSHHLGDGCPNLCGWGNREMQFFTDNKDNLTLEDGYLKITAKEDVINGYKYSSSRIHTDNKFEFQYGRIDIRAAMPSATGTWVAFWLLNQKYLVQKPGAHWPSGGEIDIMEFLGQDHEEILGTAHYGTDFPNNHRFNSKKYRTNKHPFDKAFYVFSIIWEEDKIQWLINDEVYHTITPETTAAANQPYPFNDKFFLILSLSVGGNLPTDPIPDEYPSSVIVDYIRVFQK